MAASDFKAQCLRVLEDVASGDEVVITKRGKEVARVIPFRPVEKSRSQDRFRGLLKVTGDITHLDWSSEFDVLK